jgi:hypothetical protein
MAIELPFEVKPRFQVITELQKVGDFGVGASQPQLVAVGSFNSHFDNTPDLFITNRDGSYTVLLGDGRGTFGVFVPRAYPRPQIGGQGGVGRIDGLAGPEGVVTGDFNDDGLTDVAVAGTGDEGVPGAVQVLRGLGNGQFELASSLDLSEGAVPTYLTAADLDEDGNTDLVVSDFANNQVQIYTGNGNLTFGLHDYNYAANGVANPEQTVVADFNGDGNLDIAVASLGDFENGTVSLFRGLGGGYITAAGFVALGKGGAIGLAAGDLDGDGLPDLAVANYGSPAQGAQTLSLLRNASTGGALTFAAPIHLNVGDHLLNVVIADFNGDRRLDLAVSSAGNTVDDSTRDHRLIVLYNQGGPPGAINPMMHTALPLVTGWNPIGLVSADLNGDGLPDLVSANQASNSVSVFLDQTRLV